MQDLMLIGTFKNGFLNGKGKLYENNKLKYEGEFKKNVFEGIGKLYYKNGVYLLYR